MNYEWNVNFLQITTYVQKVSRYETVFTKTEMNNKSNINFLQNSPLSIQHTYSS